MYCSLQSKNSTTKIKLSNYPPIVVGRETKQLSSTFNVVRFSKFPKKTKKQYKKLLFLVRNTKYSFDKIYLNHQMLVL